jgi:hypothetical protein
MLFEVTISWFGASNLSVSECPVFVNGRYNRPIDQHRKYLVGFRLVVRQA